MNNTKSSSYDHTELIQQIERRLNIFLPAQAKEQIYTVIRNNHCSGELITDMYIQYYREHRFAYQFDTFCRMMNAAEEKNTKISQQCLNEPSPNEISIVLQELGMQRKPTRRENDLYRKWHTAWHFDLEMILLAAGETINARTPSFAYMDAVLKDWAERGITTPKRLDDEKLRFAKQKNKDYMQKNSRISQKFAPEGRDLSFLEK